MSRDPASYLTAYADGQLSPAGVAAMEQALAEQPELRAKLDDIRALQAALRNLPAAPEALRPVTRSLLMSRAEAGWRFKPVRRMPRPTSRLMWLAAAALIVLLVGGTLIPAFSVAKSFAHRSQRSLDHPESQADAPPMRITDVPASSAVFEGKGKDRDTSAHWQHDQGVVVGAVADNNPVAAGENGASFGSRTGGGRRRQVAADAAGGPAEQDFTGINRIALGVPSGTLERKVAEVENGIKGEHKPALASPSTPAQPRSKVAQNRREANEQSKDSKEEGDARRDETVSRSRTSGATPSPVTKPPAKPPEIAATGRSSRIKEVADKPQEQEELRALANASDGRLVGHKGRADGAASVPKVLEKQKASELAYKKVDSLDNRNWGSGKTEAGANKNPLTDREKRDHSGVLSLERFFSSDIAAKSPEQLAAALADVAPSPILDGDALRRLANLANAYQVPMSLTRDAEGLLAGSAQLPPASGLSNGEQIVMLGNRAGLQVVMANGRITLNPAPIVLDPTDRLGLEPAAFTAAFGTPPMAIVRRDAQLTFALDADTASFARARADLLDNNRLPDPATIRPEHFINAVPADYPAPTGREAFALYAEAGPSPFARGRHAQRSALVAVGVVGRAADADERKPLRLVVAIDASGSMAKPGAMDRARIALDGLTAQLNSEDRVAVVSFAERGRIVIPATPGHQAPVIRRAFDSILPSGATNTGEGLALACQVARELAAPGTALRVVLVTDGAAIAGSDETTASERVGALKAVGGSLLILAVGERAADTRALDSLTKAGDGQQIFLGSDDEARRAVTSTLLPERLNVLARDAKAQVTWNPERVTHARLVGYEKRRLSHRDFRNDAVDAGEIPTATVVTALFEVVLADGGSGPLGTAAVRYLDTRLDAVRELACPMPGAILAPVASPRLRTLACAAELAEQLRGSWWANVRPIPFRSIAAACVGLPAPADQIAQMAQRAEQLRPLPEVRP